jgi:hypothetical protein
MTAEPLVASKVVPTFRAVALLSFVQVWLVALARVMVITPVPAAPEAVFPLMLTTPELLVLLIPPEPIVKVLFPEATLGLLLIVKVPVLRKVMDLAAGL